MIKCRLYDELFQKFINGEIDAEEEKKYDGHLKECPSCREQLEIHQSLADPVFNLPFPEPEEFSKMRRTVLQHIRVINLKQKKQYFLGLFDILFHQRARSIYAVVAFIMVFLLGFYANLLIQPELDSDLVNTINYTAAKNTALQEVENSPYVFSDVQFQKVDEVNIALSFTVSAHLDLIRPKQDPLVKEVLAQTLLNPESVGTRLKSISFATGMMDTKIKESLVFALHHDPSRAVRIKAMASLMDYPEDEEIQDAFLALLKNEASVNLRLLAIDYLTQGNIQQSVLRGALPYLKKGQDIAVRQRIIQYIGQN
jgi:hypothetical protein